MIWLRLDRPQLVLVLLAVAFLVGAIAALVAPTPALPEPAVPSAREGATIEFEPPLFAVANDPTSPLVEGNPFDDSRQPPAQRRTTTSAQDEAAALLADQGVGVNFVLLGTVVRGSGRNIAVIQGNPLTPGGGTYHIGDEVMPGYRLTRITREGATISGGGQAIVLEINTPQPGAQAFDEEYGEEDEE